MDLGMTGYQMLVADYKSYAADAPVDNNVQVEETSDTMLAEFVIPTFAEIVAFGVVITEDFVTQATDPVVELGSRPSPGATVVVLKDLTLGNSNTHTVNGVSVVRLTKGDGDDDNVTALAADTDLDTGNVVYADLSGVDRHLDPGEVLILKHLTAATGAGGAYVPFAIVKFSGPDFTRSNVWREKQTGEAVGS